MRVGETRSRSPQTPWIIGFAPDMSATLFVWEDQQLHLWTLREHTNPRQPRAHIQGLVTQHFALLRATAGNTQSIY